ncbi:MAG: alcohol dehydrogenase zinc-binding protein [Xanthobacteraceae bacterium]|jgi:NADPH2:quinone reductase|nr:alcohol dehydrogenase zinc-binding protein [Xanthobacteraceae bacterium]
MKAILCTRLGTARDLELADIPDPVAGPGEVVVRIAAAGLNFFDTLLIAGRYQFKPELPFSPAAEFAGTVESLGTGVAGLAIGDPVMGFSRWGNAREKIAIPAGRVVKLVEGLDFERAAGLSVTYGTSLYALKDRGHLKPGETLAVLGASGGVGLAAVELGKQMGARVIACASSDDKLDFAREHGADALVNYAETDLREELRRLTDGRGVDVVYDPVGGAYAEPALRSLAWYGRYLVVGFAAGDIPKIPLNLVLLKSCDVVGVFWGSWTERDPEGHQANMADLVNWAAQGKLSAHVHAVYPLADAARAIDDIAARKVMGKAILKIS